MEVKKQVETALIVTVREIGKTVTEKQKQGKLNVINVETVGTGLVNRQFYQYVKGIMVVVKYALS